MYAAMQHILLVQYISEMHDTTNVLHDITYMCSLLRIIFKYIGLQEVRFRKIRKWLMLYTNQNFTC
jgi:hypothetical protein